MVGPKSVDAPEGAPGRRPLLAGCATWTVDIPLRPHSPLLETSGESSHGFHESVFGEDDRRDLEGVLIGI